MRNVIDLAGVQRRFWHVPMGWNRYNSAEFDQRIMWRVRHLCQAWHIAAISLASLVLAQQMTTGTMLVGEILASGNISTLAESRTIKRQERKGQAREAGWHKKSEKHFLSPHLLLPLTNDGEYRMYQSWAMIQINCGYTEDF